MPLILEQASPGFFTSWKSQVFKAARESKPQCTNIFQASTCIVFANVPLVNNGFLPITLKEQPVIATSEWEKELITIDEVVLQ